MALNGSFWTHRKFVVQISSKKMKSLCNRWVFVRNCDTLKVIVQFVHEVHPVFAVTLSTFLHTLCGWNDDTLWSFNLFKVHFVVVFTFTVIYSENKWVNASKIANYVRKGWKLMTWIWIVHLNAKNVRSCTKLLKYWIAGVTDEFLSKTLILRKRLSSLYMKCIQFLP